MHYFVTRANNCVVFQGIYGTFSSWQGHPWQRLQHGALPRALVSYDGDGRQRQVLLHTQRAERVDEVDAGTHLLLVLFVQTVHGRDSWSAAETELKKESKRQQLVVRCWERERASGASATDSLLYIGSEAESQISKVRFRFLNFHKPAAVAACSFT